MPVLLDTHAIVWWLLGDERLSPAASLAISEAREVIVSAASAWELSTKVHLGRWPEAQDLARDLGQWVQRQGMTALDVTMEHCARAGNLSGPHRNPFDRMLIAQCQAEDVALVSADDAADGYGVRRIW